MKTIRIGIIGAGQNTRKMHLPKLQAIPGVEILEVANRSLDSAKDVANTFGIPHVRDSWRDVATSTNIDAVVIGTWPYLHCEAACLALESGKHVLCEARMAMDAKEAEQMLAVSGQHPQCVAQLVPAPFTLGIDQTIKDIIDCGQLGNLRYFQADYQSAPLAIPGNELHWRRNKKFSGMNIMVLGIIYESLLRWLPKARWVQANGKIFSDTAFDLNTGKPVKVEIPDYLSVQTELENGMAGSFLLSEAGKHATPPNIHIFGDRGTLKIEFMADSRLWYGSNQDDTLTEVIPALSKRGSWRVEEEFIRAIRNEEEVKLTPFSTGVEYMRFTEAVYNSYQNAGDRLSLASPGRA